MLDFHYSCTGVVSNKIPGLVKHFWCQKSFSYDLSKYFKFGIEVTTSPTFWKKYKKQVFSIEILIFRKPHVFYRTELNIHCFCKKLGANEISGLVEVFQITEKSHMIALRWPKIMLKLNKIHWFFYKIYYDNIRGGPYFGA